MAKLTFTACVAAQTQATFSLDKGAVRNGTVGEGTPNMTMVFALVLLGCADDGSACERLSAEPQLYSSAALCRANQELALQSEAARRSDYPTVFSRCVRANADGDGLRRR